MSIAFRIAGLVVAAALALWCLTIAIHSFTPQAGAGLPRLAGGIGLQALLGFGALVTLGLVVAATIALTRSPGSGSRPFWLVGMLLVWAVAAALVAARAGQLFLAPVDYELGVGTGVAAAVAPAWQAYFWTVAAVCAALAGGLLVRWALASRAVASVTRPAA